MPSTIQILIQHMYLLTRYYYRVLTMMWTLYL
nr:MAG TPA: hypothetical protein [Caudoviricetes sp.]